MMSDKPDFAEKLGTAINELDIDFSRFTFAGWVVSLLALGTGGGIAFLVGSAMVRRNGLNPAAGLVFCFVMIALTTVTFFVLRWAIGLAGVGVTKTNSVAGRNDASVDTLKRMANAGMSMNAVHVIDFWHRFESKHDAESMGRKARQQSFQVAAIEPNVDSGGYDVLIQVALVPTLSAINATEQTLAALAAQSNGQADGWGVKQTRRRP